MTEETDRRESAIVTRASALCAQVGYAAAKHLTQPKPSTSPSPSSGASPSASPTARPQGENVFGYHRRQMRCLPIALLLAAVIVSCGGPATTETTATTGGRAADALSRGLQAHAAGKLDEATAAYFETLAKEPKNKFAFYNLGVIAQGQNRPVAAESYYRLALEQDASMTSALFNLAILRGLAGANQDAAELYRRVIAVEPNNAAAHFNLGLVLRLLGQTAEAQAEFATAQRLDPKLVAPSPSASPARQASPSPAR
jgi:Tfp pilus assembly protein PilF